MNSKTRPKLEIVVLAAGLSTRLGSPKLEARIRGVSLLRKTVRLLAPLAASRIIVVVPPRALRARVELRGLRVTFVENPGRARGLSTSVRRGLAAARWSAAVVLLPVDLAHLKHLELARMIMRWNGARRRVIARRLPNGATSPPGTPPGTSPDTTPPAGMTSGGAPRGGAPVIVPRWLYARALGIAGDSGLKELISRLPRNQVALLDLPSASWDVDTPQDLARARHRMRP
jgi:molybdenum cofactor cytidylyltransferase